MPMADQLEADRQALYRDATRQRYGRVAGDVEYLRQAEHQRADRFLLPVDHDRLGACPRGRDRHRGKDERVDIRERPFHFTPQHVTSLHRAHVVLGQDVPPGLQAAAHHGCVAIRVRIERSRVIGRALRRMDVDVHGRRHRGTGNIRLADAPA